LQGYVIVRSGKARERLYKTCADILGAGPPSLAHDEVSTVTQLGDGCALHTRNRFFHSSRRVWLDTVHLRECAVVGHNQNQFHNTARHPAAQHSTCHK
jgi:hypothetical protein